MKVVVNRCFGGFGLSDAFCKKYPQFADYDSLYVYNNSRTDTDFIKAIEEFGESEASDVFANIQIVELPDGISDWELSDYDGAESIIYVLDGIIYHA